MELQDTDRAVDSLNNWFGHEWVTRSLDALQAYLQWAHPEIAWLVYTLHDVEQQSIDWPRMAKLTLSVTKKQRALRRARGY